jgi:hypothetical protein
MPRFTLRDALWSMAIVAIAVVLIAFGQSVLGPSIEGSACSVLAAIVLIGGFTRIYRRAQARSRAG